jgi:putative transposase
VVRHDLRQFGQAVSCSGKVWNNAAMESSFSSLKTERTGRKTTEPETRRDQMYSTTSRSLPQSEMEAHLSPMEFESQVGLAYAGQQPRQQSPECKLVLHSDLREHSEQVAFASVVSSS